MWVDVFVIRHGQSIANVIKEKSPELAEGATSKVCLEDGKTCLEFKSDFYNNCNKKYKDMNEVINIWLYEIDD